MSARAIQILNEIVDKHAIPAPPWRGRAHMHSWVHVMQVPVGSFDRLQYALVEDSEQQVLVLLGSDFSEAKRTLQRVLQEER